MQREDVRSGTTVLIDRSVIEYVTISKMYQII